MFDAVLKRGAAGAQLEAARRSPTSPPGAHALRLAVSSGAPRALRKCSCGGSGGTCPECEAEKQVQTKLEVGPPGDEYEREAESVADQVMRMPDPALEEEEV